MKTLKLIGITIIQISVILFLFSCNKIDSPDIDLGAGISIVSLEQDTTSFKVEFIPDSTATSYEYAIGTEEDYEAFANGTFTDCVMVEGNEKAVVEFGDLESQKEYTVFARAFNGKLAGGIAVLKVRTDDNDFSAEVVFAHQNSLSIRINMTSDYSSFRYYLGTPDDKTSFLEETIGDMVTGVNSYTCVNYFDLNAENYIFYLIGYDRKNMPTKMYEIPIALKKDVPSAEFKIEYLDLYRGKYRIVPNEKCSKITCILGSKGEYDQTLKSSIGFRNDLIRWITSWETLPHLVNSYTAKGEDLVFTFDDVNFSREEMEAYFLMYDENFEPAGVKRIIFSKPEVDPDAPEAKVDIKVLDITEKGATYIYTPDKNTLGFMYDTVEADWFDDFSQTSEYHSTYLHERMFQAGKYWAYSGDLDDNMQREFKEETGESNTRYYATACPMNINGPGEGWCELNMVEYTTK